MEMSQVPRTAMSLVCQLTAQVEGREAALGTPSPCSACLPAYECPHYHQDRSGRWAWAFPSAPCGQGSTHSALFFSFQQHFDGRAQDVRKSLLSITHSLPGPLPFPEFSLPFTHLLFYCCHHQASIADVFTELFSCSHKLSVTLHPVGNFC